MQPHSLVAIVTILSLLLYVSTILGVTRARQKSGIQAPTMTGDPILERSIRVQMNTLEWLPIYLAALWLFAIYWNDLVAALAGLVWIVGRFLYGRAYIADPAKRELGFTIQSFACAVLLLGALGRIVYVLAVPGA
jgi:glutathione S-transferase